ncbi:MAG: hypothetical protein AMJ90_10055 [candidate division Zixibacteria bacterium SM23_73_2]|nr:MAG: hypothetical protein AMJ90_10055 [candidate division Zixibacteria bacterium SM23_73_2]
MEFTLKQINLFTLKSHFLFDNAEKSDLVKVVDQICGLNAQTARAPYISLWSRIKNFKKDQLKKALYKDKTLVKTWLMRGTVHIVSARDFPVYQKALRNSLVGGWERFLKKKEMVLAPREKKKLFQKTLDILSRKSLTIKELLPEIKGVLKGYSEDEEKIFLGRALRALSYLGIICHGEPTGSWYHFKENRFTAVCNQLKGFDIDKLDEKEAKAKLLLKYLHSYGPASAKDFSYWTGFKANESKQIFEEVKDKLVEIKIKDAFCSLWMLKKDLSSLENINTRKKPPTSFLPEFDSLIMGHKDKSRIMDDKHRGKVFLPLAGVAPVFLLNGKIKGSWNFKMSDRKIKLSLFEKTGTGDKSKIEKESKRLKQFIESD